MNRFPWTALGIEETRDQAVIRKAYADALRELDLDKDIDGYAQLRRARDEALWLASQDDQDDGDYGLGSFDDDIDDIDLSSVRFSETDAGSPQDLDWSGVNAETAGSGGFEDPAPPPEPELTEAQQKARTAWQGLWDILIPNGDYSDDAITLDQLDQGNAHLEVLTTHAEQCDITEHDALDHGLAQLFAEAWPRSAPFVEPAAEAFHWLDESGQIEERPALMFLNLRLRGMRFHEQVQEADHPLNKAWVELSRDGKANFIDRLKVKREDIDTLLRGIRERYPEVETYLNGERVASWETAPHSAGPRIVQWLFIGFVIVQALRFLGGANELPDFDQPDATAPVRAELSEAEINTRLSALFGDGTTINDVRDADPVFADQIRATLETERFGFITLEGFVRSRATHAAEIAEFDELVARGELQRMWMTVAAAHSSDLCKNVMAADFNSIPLELDQAQRMRESQLLKQLLEAGVLSHSDRRSAGRFSVPGWAVEATMERARLSQEQVSQALNDPNHELRCLVDRTLLGVVLEQPGRVSPELLRAL